MKRYVIKRVHLRPSARLPEAYYQTDGGWQRRQSRAHKFVDLDAAVRCRRELARGYAALRNELAVRIIPLRSAS